MSGYVTSIQILDADGGTVDIHVETADGDVEIIGEIVIADRRLSMKGVHIDGPGRGVLGRGGLGSIARRFMEELDVDEIEIFGAIRTTGRNPGKAPRPVRIRR